MELVKVGQFLTTWLATTPALYVMTKWMLALTIVKLKKVKRTVCVVGIYILLIIHLGIQNTIHPFPVYTSKSTSKQPL